MDDFEYSVFISDQDWEMFYRECEGCKLLCPGLAAREDSGVSDVDEMVHHSMNLLPPPAWTEADPDLQTDGPPVDSYLSNYGVCGPEQVLSGSEEDLQQLKGIVEPQQLLEESHASNVEGLNVNQVIQSVDIPPAGRNGASLTGETAKQGEFDTCSCTDLEEAVGPTSTNTQINASDSTDRELGEIGGEPSLLQVVTEGIKHEQEKSSCDLSTELHLKSEAKLPETMTQVVRRLPDSNPEKKNKTKLETGSSSNLRRKRRKKRRVCNESRETSHGYEAQLRVCQSESEEERFSLREEINCQTTDVRKTDHPSLSSTPHHSDHLPSGCSFGSSDGLKYSKSLPEFTAFEVRHGSMNNVCRSVSDMFLLKSGALESELCQMTMLPQIRKVLNSQESGIGSSLTECDSVTQLEDTDCSPALSRSDLTDTFTDRSAAWQRKSLLSANISTDSTETLSSSRSLSMTEDTCLSKTFCEQNMQSKMNMRRNSDTESGSDGNGVAAFQHVDITKSQTFEISTDGPLSEINSHCHKTENTVLSDHEKDCHIQNLNKSCEELNVNNSQMIDLEENESSEFPSRSYSVARENDSDPTITGNDMMFFGSNSSFPEHLNTANAQQVFSVQDLQAIEAPPVRPMKRKTSLHSIHVEAEDLFYHINTSCSACSSDDEEMESSGVTFSEIIQYFFGGEEPERCVSPADSAAASVLDETGACVPEMYDHFFSEFESGSFFNLFEDESGGNKDKMVPIFSCSRSTNRPLQFPEAYDYFFPDSPVHSDEDDESDSSATTVVTWYDQESSNHCPVSTIDMYEHFYPEDTFQDNFLWENPFSFRRAGHSDPAAAEEDSCSWALTPVKPHTGAQAVTVMGPDDRSVPQMFYLSLEKHMFQQLAEQQKKCLEIQTVTADPRLDAVLLPLGQADMCLICIAFASWVLKSASPGADAWKAALLANVSALSAIRYLRRHKKEVSGKALLQIESV